MFKPDAALQEFIACLFVAENVIGTHEPNCFSPFPPNPQNSMLLYVRDPVLIRNASGDIVKSHPCLLVGPHTQRVDSKMGKHNLMVYVGFKPGALYRLLGIPMNLVINTALNGADYFGSEIGNLLDRLQVAAGYPQMIDHVTKFLLAKVHRMKQLDSFDHAMQYLVRMSGNISMDKIAALSCLSSRQFERKSYERIGLPPKLYARIARFSKAYRIRELDPNLSWTEIAHTSGYFDQMHFIRDFKVFAGITPTVMDQQLGNTQYKLQADLII